MKKSIISFCFLLLSICVFAQKSSIVPELIVTESRNQTNGINAMRFVQVIDSVAIRLNPASTIAELLENTAGIDIRSRGPFGTQADVQIRGGSFEQTLVLLNGVRLTDPQTGHHLLNLPISTFDIARIEVLKGAAARVFGQNAYAGVINIITQKAIDNSVSVLLSGGDNYFRQALFGIDLNGKKVKHHISLQHLSADGHRKNTDFTNQQIYYQSDFNALKGSFLGMAGFQEKNTGSNGFYTDRFPWQFETTQMGFVGLNYQHNNNKFRARTALRLHDDEFLLKRDTPSFARNTHSSLSYNLDLNYTSQNKFGVWNLGADLRYDQINSNSLGNRNRMILGVFADQTFNLGERFKIIPGLCFSSYSDFGLTTYPSLDLAYKINSVSFSGQVSRCFRVPSFTELYYSDGGKTSIGNPELKPEQAWSYEANMFIRKPFFTLSASLFRRDGLKQIDWIKDSATALSWIAQNQTEIQTDGYELSLDIKPAYFRENAFINKINFSYCSLDLNQLKTIGISRYAFDYLKSQFTASTQFKINENFDFFLRTRNENRVSYTAYWLWDGKLQYKHNRTVFFAEASNLFDITYKEVGNVIMPGRWIRFGLSFKLMMR